MRHRIPQPIAKQITGERRLGGRTYYLMRRLGTHGNHFKAFLPEAGPNGGFRVVHEFDRNRINKQHIGVLESLVKESNGGFPPILEYCPAPKSIFVITDWVRGHSLQEHLSGARTASNEGEKKIAVKETVKLFRLLAGDLFLLHHKRNLVHGDLKPENLIVRRQRNRLVMVDFGSAWLPVKTNARHAGDGHTPHYSSPELRSDGLFADFRADIFSASAIFFEMLTLQKPYGGSGGKVAELPPEYAETYQPPSELCPERGRLTDRAWAAIDRLVTTGLQLDPAQRYQSGSDWLADIQAMSTALNEKDSAFDRVKATLSRPMSWLRQGFR
jgi:serine/threonine protein kinase